MNKQSVILAYEIYLLEIGYSQRFGDTDSSDTGWEQVQQAFWKQIENENPTSIKSAS